MPGNIRLKPFHRMKEEEFKEDFEINVLGAIKALQFFMPALKAVQQSSVVLFSTVAATRGMSFHTSTAASKAALEGLALSLAAEWAPAVRVNVIAPSLTDTPLAANLLSTDDKRQASSARHPLKRVGSAEDIAAMARFLLLPDSAWMTGQVLHVDGGLSVI
jgi:NAD(P)-dependent dehydrogenase (short-subunit alcohol dehydrogenase family)